MQNNSNSNQIQIQKQDITFFFKKKMLVEKERAA